jgi:LmbE family N-acetylglucosaminyl deacetylase
VRSPISRIKAITNLILLSLLLSQQALFNSSRAVADNRPPEDRGAAGLGQAIKRLGVVASVLHTGAHPDDEDSGLLAYLARGRQARTAYLSLTRGDGGQNVIGPQLYEPLGVIRTEELLAARRMDGASQYFSRAFDFGFSKSRTETLAKWNRDEVLADMVRVIRTFRPLVIASAWSGTPNDGHGHHQAAGFLTQEAYRAAADPNRFPEQIKQGLRTWQARKLYLRSFDGMASPRELLPSLATLSLNTGEFDPLLGQSYYEIAARGRSQHRSQDAGAIEARGPRFSRMRLIDSKVGPIKNEKDIFDDLDVTLAGIAEYAGKAASQLKGPLSEVQSAANEARYKYQPLSEGSLGPVIARGLKKLREIRASLAGMGASPAELAETDFLLKLKEADFVDALAKSRGVIVDCLTDDEVVTPGQTITVTVAAYSDTGARVTRVALSTPAGWSVVQQKQADSSTSGRVLSQTEFKVTLARDAEATSPYWLKNPRRGDMFGVPSSDGSSSAPVGIEPVSLPALSAKVEFENAGELFEVTQKAEYRYVDRAIGEIRRELKVAPAISVNVSPDILVYPFSNTPQKREVTVAITNNAKDGARGAVKLEAGPQWKLEPPSAIFDLKREGERAAFSFTVTVPATNIQVIRQIHAVATAGGSLYRQGYQVIAYPHIESQFVYQDATANAEVIDVKVAPGLKVGYIEGAGDDFAEALKRIGVDVKTIESKELASGDLSIYDAIVAGVRVYEVRPDVIANNARLMEYANRGGTYIVQYSRGNFETGGFAPYRTGKEAPAQRDQRPDPEPRLFYLNEADLASAFSAKSTAKPKAGFIGGASDQALESMRSAGLEARGLESSDLAGDLSQLDVIVVGPDAGSRPGLAEYNSRLLEYSRRKLLILTFTQAQFISGEFPRFPRPDARPFRVTDETAKVTILEPDHPRFNFPNKITERDFDGWVQERGAYFLGDRDARFKPLMACHDPGEPDLKGGEVIAEHGKGLYVYTAYAWFRQLPKGVPGAYRLIANLVSLPKAKIAR